MQKIPVGLHAIFLRINKSIAKNGLHIYKARKNSEKWKTLGRFYLVKTDVVREITGSGNRSFYGEVVRTNLDLNSYAHELGLLQPNEFVIGE